MQIQRNILMFSTAYGTYGIVFLFFLILQTKLENIYHKYAFVCVYVRSRERESE